MARIGNNQNTIRSVITPNDKFLRDVFSNPKAYYIDIYQREYKWKPSNVLTLLRDIESRFAINKRSQSEPKAIQEEVQEHFEPYFLNTYLTHSTANRILIVDGQQRLTTFLLIFISLYKILKKFEDRKKERKNNNDPYFCQENFSSNALRQLIYESDDFEGPTRFKIFNENREEIFRQIVDDKDIVAVDETQQHIAENFTEINKYFEKLFQYKDAPDRYDIAKLTYYITYILDRISIVEIKIEKQKNIATIFEVVNDRGLGLKPYEILKGKLLGNLPPDKKEQANEVWTRLQNDYFNAEVRHSIDTTDNRVDLDNFFRTFFRAKFADSENDYDKFEGAYHYEIYQNPKTRKYFQDFSDSGLLFDLIVKDIQYFACVYLRLRAGYDDEYLVYNKLLDQNQQYLLILSCLMVNDNCEKLKISGIARKFDQFHTIIRLLDEYESSSFQRMIYPVNQHIREKPLGQAEGVFDNALIKSLVDAELLREGEVESIQHLFTFRRFLDIRNRWTNFSKYVLMRIDRYLSSILDKPSYAGGDLEELEDRFNKNNRRIYGMHLEHIYAFNDPNRAIFTNENNDFDEQQFNMIRNRLGMVLLLKDKQNISSGNEVYKDKIDTYKTSNFIWNEMLAGHLHGVDEKILPATLRSTMVLPDETGAFPKQRVPDRQQLIFEAIKLVWCDLIETNGMT